MSRDMQVGLLLAVGFIALVGGVLYYRMEHPDELEQYLASANEPHYVQLDHVGPTSRYPCSAFEALP